MKVLMLGWEFPPYFAGGVGTVCYELSKALSKRNIDITYIMPVGPQDASSDHMKLLVAGKKMRNVIIKTIPSLIAPYGSQAEYKQAYDQTIILRGTNGKLYGPNLLEEMERFAFAVLDMAQDEHFDLIHAHDWTTIPAALALKKKTGKPIVMHVHITEFDKTGGQHADPQVYSIEHRGFHAANIIIAVSNFVKRRLIEQYHVDPKKIRVVHNSVAAEPMLAPVRERISEQDKVVLFLGRVTLQKGPDYFLEAAAKVAHLVPNVKFIIAGTGDMLARMIERSAQLGLGSKVIFPGFVSREEGDRLYRLADLFVMPSVSEPFGIVPLEAMRQGTPVIVSRQSGVCEVIQHALKVDFWDIDDLANKMIAALSYNSLHHTLRHHGMQEIQGFTWETPADACVQVYHEVTGG